MEKIGVPSTLRSTILIIIYCEQYAFVLRFWTSNTVVYLWLVISWSLSCMTDWYWLGCRYTIYVVRLSLSPVCQLSYCSFVCMAWFSYHSCTCDLCFCFVNVQFAQMIHLYCWIKHCRQGVLQMQEISDSMTIGVFMWVLYYWGVLSEHFWVHNVLCDACRNIHLPYL